MRYGRVLIALFLFAVIGSEVLRAQQQSNDSLQGISFLAIGCHTLNDAIKAMTAEKEEEIHDLISKQKCGIIIVLDYLRGKRFQRLIARDKKEYCLVESIIRKNDGWLGPMIVAVPIEKFETCGESG